MRNNVVRLYVQFNKSINFNKKFYYQEKCNSIIKTDYQDFINKCSSTAKTVVKNRLGNFLEELNPESIRYNCWKENSTQEEEYNSAGNIGLSNLDGYSALYYSFAHMCVYDVEVMEITLEFESENDVRIHKLKNSFKNILTRYNKSIEHLQESWRVLTDIEVVV